jgi:hypothetical protein
MLARARARRVSMSVRKSAIGPSNHVGVGLVVFDA